jgi:hypothetical protein
MLTSNSKSQVLVIFAIFVVIVLVSAGYVFAVGAWTDHQTPQLVETWSDPDFAGNWSLSYLNVANASWNRTGPILQLSTTVPTPVGAIVAAQLRHSLSVPLNVSPYLGVTVRVSNIDIAVRLTVWPTPNASQIIMVQLSTFDNAAWHELQVFLPYFGLVGTWTFPIIELSFLVVDQTVPPGAWIQFENFGFYQLKS